MEDFVVDSQEKVPAMSGSKEDTSHKVGSSSGLQFEEHDEAVNLEK